MLVVYLSYFNSIKVQLEHAWGGMPHLWMYHFNSIKVQLERLALALLNGNGRFQFHKGTIRTA